MHDAQLRLAKMHAVNAIPGLPGTLQHEPRAVPSIPELSWGGHDALVHGGCAMRPKRCSTCQIEQQPVLLVAELVKVWHGLQRTAATGFVVRTGRGQTARRMSNSGQLVAMCKGALDLQHEASEASVAHGTGRSRPNDRH